jgi:DNA-binding IclR family transcriptional regulator
MVSLGRVLLAALAAESKTAYLASGTFKPVTPRTVTDPHRLGEQLARVESDGYDWADGEPDTAICGITVPLRGPAGSVVAALSINAISGTITEAAAKRKLLLSVEENRPGNSEPGEQLANSIRSDWSHSSSVCRSPSGPRELSRDPEE